jgi:hypothetical protein
VCHRGDGKGGGGPSSDGGLVARKQLNRDYRTCTAAASDCRQDRDSDGPQFVGDRVVVPWQSERFYISRTGPATRPAAACHLLIGGNRESLV